MYYLSMARAYHVDLRQRVVNCVRSGKSMAETSRIFKVSEDSVQRWMKLVKDNNLAPKKVGGNNRKIDEKALKSLVEKNPDKLQYEMAQELGVKQTGICRALKRLKLTRKKRAHFTKSEIKKREKSLGKR